MSSTVPDLGWLQSLALRTDLFLVGADADIMVDQNWIAVRTPAFPTLRTGNALLFPRIPTPADVEEWVNLLLTKVGDAAETTCRIAWEGGAASAETYRQFTAMGFEPYDSLSMMTDAVVARPGSASASVRAVHGENDWADLLNFQRRLSDALGVEDEGFVTQRLELLRRRAHQGCAAWFTSHQDGQVIGSCGVLLGHGVARLQQLETTQEHRRAGVATSLVIAAAQWAFAQTNVARLVAVADPKYHAASLFRTLGFRDHDLACGVAPAGTVPAHIS